MVAAGHRASRSVPRWLARDFHGRGCRGDQTTSPWSFDWAQLADIAELPEKAEIIDAREVGNRGTDLGNCMEIDCTSSIDGDSMSSDDELCTSPELAVASGGA